MKKSIVILILIVVILGALMLGRYPIGFESLHRLITVGDSQVENVLFHIRLPRILASLMIGLALSTAGSAYQTLFRNPMVSPSVLGSTAGAGFGAAIAIFFNFSPFLLIVCSFSFGLLAVGFTIYFSRHFSFNNLLGLVLTGMVVSALFSAFISYVKLVSDPQDTLPAITYWLMGSLSNIGYQKLLLAAIPITLGFFPLFFMRYKINILGTSEEEAMSLGLQTKKLRLIVILCATLLSASAVAISGMISWVGLIIPHFARLLVGESLTKSLPLSALFGAIYLTLIDTLARTLHTAEIPIGILTAIIGAPVFLIILRKVIRKK